MNLSRFLPFHNQTDKLDVFGIYIYIYMGESSLKPSQMINEKDYFCGFSSGEWNGAQRYGA